MTWLEVITPALLPPFLLLDLLRPARAGVRARWWRTRAFVVTTVNFWLSSGRRPAQGFYDGASARLGDMLLFRDVSVPSK